MAMFKTKEQLLKEQLGEEGFQMLEQIKRVKSRKGIQAMMPYEIQRFINLYYKHQNPKDNSFLGFFFFFLYILLKFNA